ncbi:MAG TPA: M24 family metallopeptidase [Bryobacteraceae bacterium]|nr:M24 family metallopeptidase [Bryobacteraceae bacterium]
MKLDEIQAALREQGLDGWLFFDHHQRDPLAYRVLEFAPEGPVTRRWYYLIPADGEPRKLVHAIESFVLDALPGARLVYSGWARQTEGLLELLAGCRRVAMQYSPQCAIPYVSMVDAGTVELVLATGVEITSSADLIQYFEARWDEEKLESHLEAGRRVDEIRGNAFRLIGEKLRAGERIREFDVKQFILDSFAAAGMVTDHGPIVGVNANAANPHYEPSADASEEIRRGDLVLIDMWAKLAKPRSVYYDITWTGFCGTEPRAEIERVFGIVREARDRAVRRVRKAVEEGEPLRGFEVDDAAREYIREQGFADQFVHRTGHSIGEDVHGAGANMDNLETHDERRVIAGTCFSVEPGIYLRDFGIRSEVNVYVGERSARVTGEAQERLVLI